MPKDATHYSKKMDAYFHWDNGLFIWRGYWEEFLECVNDLIEIAPL